MYPTDTIYGYLNITESDSPIEQFEDLGYEGANFINLTGSLIINILVGLLAGVLISVALFFAKKLYMYEFVRKNALILKTSNIFYANM